MDAARESRIIPGGMTEVARVVLTSSTMKHMVALLDKSPLPLKTALRARGATSLFESRRATALKSRNCIELERFTYDACDRLGSCSNELGRYAVGPHVYVYSAGRPIVSTDPSGLICGCELWQQNFRQERRCEVFKHGNEWVLGGKFSQYFRFRNAKGNSCNCCSYRQYVRTKLNVKVEESVRNFEYEVSDGKNYREDCDTNCYGHRMDGFEKPGFDYYSPTGCTYEMSDSPEQPLASLGGNFSDLIHGGIPVDQRQGFILKISLLFDFKIEIIDTCRNSVVYRLNYILNCGDERKVLFGPDGSYKGHKAF